MTDQQLTSLCLWREARGEGNQGMTAVGCVIRNRVAKRHSSYAIEVMRPWQFTSMSVASDPEYHLQPQDSDASWTAAQAIAEQIIAGELADVTGGATLYWNPNVLAKAEIAPLAFRLNDGSMVHFPKTWDASKVSETCVIGHHVFLKEIPGVQA